jgi:hypothetical protein
VGTYTITDTAPRELAGMIASDLRQFARQYEVALGADIRDFMAEIEALLRGGFLATYAFGFWRSEAWVTAWRYTVRDGEIVGARPGGIDANRDVAGADYLNCVTYTQAWVDLTAAQRAAFRAALTIQRTPMQEPSDTGGSWVLERSFGAGSTAIIRQQFRR